MKDAGTDRCVRPSTGVMTLAFGEVQPEITIRGANEKEFLLLGTLTVLDR